MFSKRVQRLSMRADRKQFVVIMRRKIDSAVVKFVACVNHSVELVGVDHAIILSDPHPLVKDQILFYFPPQNLDDPPQFDMMSA